MIPARPQLYVWPERPPVPRLDSPVIVRVPATGHRPAARAHLRQVLREIVGTWTGERDINLTETSRGPIGKEKIGDKSIRFSLSYTSQEGWIALACGQEVGLDVLTIEPVPEWENLVQLYLPPAYRTGVRMASDRPRAFAQAWTRREAELKLIGRPLREYIAAEEPAFPPFQHHAQVYADRIAVHLCWLNNPVS